MAENVSLDGEISRILASDTSQRLTSELKTINSRDSRIEEEILMKSTQIARLQTFLRGELANIQGIVEENSRLKKEVEVLQRGEEVRAGRCGLLEKEISELKETNLASNYVIRRLEEKNQELNDQIVGIRAKSKKNTQQVQIQTEEVKSIQKSCKQTNLSVGVNTSVVSGQQEKQDKQNTRDLLAHIAELEQIIMHLRFEKSELKLKLHCSEPGQLQSVVNTETNEQQEIQKRMTTFEVISMVCDDQLNEVSFKGQILNGGKEGKGICEYEEGIQYEGEFHSNTRHGLGSLFVNDQMLYHGFWREGLMEGKGVLHMLEGEIESYEGNFREGKIQGYGYMKLKSGKKILGFWQDGRMVGKCMESVGKKSRFTEPELIQCY